MRLWCAPLIRERSGDLCGMGLVVYELIGMLSRAFSSNALAACAMTDEVPARVVRIGEPGFKGRGGGARTGSELSHLDGWNRVSDGILERCEWGRSETKHTWGCAISNQLRRTVGGGLALGLWSSPFRWRTLCMIVVQVRRNELRNAGSKPGWMSLCSETE
jgi:hypothetical protein